MKGKVYEWIKRKKLELLAVTGCLVGLGMIMSSMNIFKTKPPENLVRVYEINAALQESIQLDYLLDQPVRDSLINYVKGLETERDSLDSLMAFTSERMNYEDAKHQARKKANILMGSGFLLAFGSVLAYIIKNLR